MPAQRAATRASKAGPEACGRSRVWGSREGSVAGGLEGPAEPEGAGAPGPVAEGVADGEADGETDGRGVISGRATEGAASGAGGSRRAHPDTTSTRPAATTARTARLIRPFYHGRRAARPGAVR